MERCRLVAAVRALVILCLVSSCSAQNWERVEKTDALRGTTYSEFALTGRFLTPPKQTSAAAPVFVVKCIPGEHSFGFHAYKSGKFLDAYMVLGAVVDFHTGGTPVHYRLDDGKIHDESWGRGTDGTAIFPAEIQLNTLLYGHFMPHKEGTSNPVRKVVIAVNEYLGAEVVMQFDMLDPTPVADACGIIIHKK